MEESFDHLNGKFISNVSYWSNAIQLEFEQTGASIEILSLGQIKLKYAKKIETDIEQIHAGIFKLFLHSELVENAKIVNSNTIEIQFENGTVLEICEDSLNLEVHWQIMKDAWRGEEGFRLVNEGAGEISKLPL